MLAVIRFFQIVDPLPRWMWAMTLGLATYGAVLLWMAPNEGDSALGALLLWQMLCASRGFVRPAAAGQFDPVLVRFARSRIAVAHFLHSTTVVGAAWLLIGGFELALGATGSRALEPGRVAAFLFVSAASWAVSLGAARLVGGALWIGTLVALAVTPAGLKLYAEVASGSDGLAQLLQALALTAVCPFLMIDVALPMRGYVALGLAGVAPIVFIAGASYIVRRSYPLELSS